MRWIRRLFVLVCLVAAGAVVWAGIYARKNGFTESWRNAIEREFANRGYHVEIGKLTLGAMRGLVAEDVVFFSDDRRSEPVAFLDDVYLDVDLGRILQKEVSVNTLDVEDARLSLPLEPGSPDGARLNVENLSGRIVITESVIEIVKADAEVAGFDVELKGALIRKSEDREEARESSAAKRGIGFAERREDVAGLLRELSRFEFIGERPSLEIDFRGDLGDLASTTATVVLDAADFRRKNNPYLVGSASAKLSFDGLSGTATLEDAIIRDEKGTLALTGVWKEDAGSIDFAIDSSADLSSLVGLFWRDKRLREVVFFEAPEVKAQGTIDLSRLGEEGPGFPGEVIGEFRAERFVTRGEVFEGLDFGFSLSGERAYVRNLRLDHASGVAFLNLFHDPTAEEDPVRFQSEIKLDPAAFRPFVDEAARKFLDAWEFGEDSTVYLGVEGLGGSLSPSSWRTSGAIDLRNFRLNGVDFEELEAEFESEGEKRWFRDVKMVRGDGVIVAELAENDAAARTWVVKGVVSDTDIVAGARAFNAKLADVLARYRFEEPPVVRLAGTLDGRRAEEVGDEPRRNELQISFESDSAARYDFFGKTIQADRSRGEISVEGSRVHLRSLEADVLGGSLQLDFLARDVRSPRRPFEAVVSVEDLPLEAVTLLYRNQNTIRGRTRATMRLAGNASDISSLQGEGTATITEGNLFSLPVLGLLSKAIAKADPGAAAEGANVAREARASFRISNGVLRTDDFEALTDSFRVRAAGEVSFVDRSLDLEAVANTRDPLTSAVLTPVSELLTFSGTGTVSDPVWEAKHVSNLVKLPTQVITGITTIPFDGIKKLGQGLFGDSPGAEASGGETEPESETRVPASEEKRPLFRIPLLQGEKGKAE